MIDMNLLIKLYEDNERELTEILDVTPTPVPVIITQSDVRTGYVTRYFVRLVNDKNFVVEIDKNQYENLKENPRFLTVKLQWKIVGKKETLKLRSGVNIFGVEDINRIEVANVDLTFEGLRRYITNYLEYWFAEEV